MSTSERSFERQIAAFLGGMAEELPAGRSTPPPAMLRRARVHVTATTVVSVVFVAVTIVLGTLATRGLLGGHGSFPVPSLIGGAGVVGDGPNGGRDASAGTGSGPLGVTAGSPGAGFGGVEGSYDRSVGGRGPDGGSWGGRVAGGPTGRGTIGRSQLPGGGTGGDTGGGASGSGGTGWEPPPPPIWIGGTAWGFPPDPNPGGAVTIGSDGGSLADAVASGDGTPAPVRAGHHHHGRGSRAIDR